jgi:hypothetical protein
LSKQYVLHIINTKLAVLSKQYVLHIINTKLAVLSWATG